MGARGAVAADRHGQEQAFEFSATGSVTDGLAGHLQGFGGQLIGALSRQMSLGKASGEDPGKGTAIEQTPQHRLEFEIRFGGGFFELGTLIGIGAGGAAILGGHPRIELVLQVIAPGLELGQREQVGQHANNGRTGHG